MKTKIACLGKLFMAFLLMVLMTEGALRLIPSVIPLNVLRHFNRTPRARIARRRELPAEADTVVFHRTDGGPRLRLFKPHSVYSRIIEDDGSVHRIEVDEVGFPNPPGLYSARSGFDIIAIGDSFTAVHACAPSECWAGRLSSLTGLSVYNLGIGGTGIMEYLQLLQSFGLPKKPRIVIMGVYAGNDLRDARTFYLYRKEYSADAVNGAGQESGASQGVARALRTGWYSLKKDWLEQHSYAFNLARSIGYLTVQRLCGEEAGDHGEPLPVNFRYKLALPARTVEFNPTNTDRDEVSHARRLRGRKIEPGVFAAIDDSLREFAALAREHGFQPVIVFLPAAHTAYQEAVSFEDPELMELMPWFHREQRAYFQDAAERRGIDFIDVTAALQRAAKGGQEGGLLYYRYDLHFTLEGQAVTAEAIREGLAERGILNE